MKVNHLIPKLYQAQPLKETRAAHQMAGDHPAPHHSQKDPPHTGFPPPTPDRTRRYSTHAILGMFQNPRSHVPSDPHCGCFYHSIHASINLRSRKTTLYLYPYNLQSKPQKLFWKFKQKERCNVKQVPWRWDCRPTCDPSLSWCFQGSPSQHPHPASSPRAPTPGHLPQASTNPAIPPHAVFF